MVGDGETARRIANNCIWPILIFRDTNMKKKETMLADIDKSDLKDTKLECFEGLMTLQNQESLSRADANKLATLFMALGTLSSDNKKLSNHFEALSCITARDGLDVESMQYLHNLQRDILKLK